LTDGDARWTDLQSYRHPGTHQAREVSNNFFGNPSGIATHTRGVQRDRAEVSIAPFGMIVSRGALGGVPEQGMLGDMRAFLQAVPIKPNFALGLRK
jgi:hypothetical protein